MFFNRVLLVVAIFFSANVYTVSSNAIEVLQNLIHPRVCRSLNFADVDITPGSARQTIAGISGVFGAIAGGNNVYISGYGDNNVYRFNSKEGDGIQALETTNIQTSIFLDVYDGFVYATSYGNGRIYRKPLVGGEYTEFLTVARPVGIKWSPDGEKLLVSIGLSATVRVYNKDLQEITTFTSCGSYAREISFDLDGNIRISGYNNGFCIYSKDDYSLLSQVTVENVVNSEGYLQHCDGTIILADRSGLLHFLDKDYNSLKVFSGFSSPADVALTDDGTLYVTDRGANTVYLYSLYSDE